MHRCVKIQTNDNKIMSKIFLVILLTTLANAQDRWALVGNPLVAVRPCNDTDDVFINYEPGKPPEEENEYSLNIEKSFPVYSRISLRFDSPASVKLFDKSFARVSTGKGDVIEIRFFKSHNGISLQVQGPRITLLLCHI
ncbi:unnamed protein product [Leptosia nina]|uniref:Uncharacterized protein n=1 Tax=Leptosia nina TaxID=320188 RepID=A0AAV1JE01_9NEOP